MERRQMMSTKGFGRWWLQPTFTYVHSLTCSFISNSDPHILNKIEILQPESLLAFTCNTVRTAGNPARIWTIQTQIQNITLLHQPPQSTHGVLYRKHRWILSQHLPTLTILLYETMAEYCHGYLSSVIQSRVTTSVQFISQLFSLKFIVLSFHYST